MSYPAPPAFAEKPNCFKCDAAFGFFKRQHHCRNCGQSFCADCSSKTAPLPEFGISEFVRVCDACYVKATAPGPRKETPKNVAAAAAPVAASKPAAFADEPVASAPVAPPLPPKKKKICTCNMPLCICPDPEEPKEEEEKSVAKVPSSSAAAAASSTPVSRPKPAGMGSASRPTFLSSSSSSAASSAKIKINWKEDLGEQIRDAIKIGDNASTIEILNAGIPPNWTDRQGQSLLHLSAMFNRTDVVLELLKRGADPAMKNGQNESVFEVAQPSLALKIRAFQAEQQQKQQQ